MLTGYRHVASKLAWSRAPCVATLVTLPLAPPFRHVTPSLSVVTCFVRDHAGDAAAGTAFCHVTPRHVTPSLNVVTCFVRDHAGDADAGAASSHVVTGRAGWSPPPPSVRFDDVWCHDTQEGFPQVESSSCPVTLYPGVLHPLVVFTITVVLVEILSSLKGFERARHSAIEAVVRAVRTGTRARTHASLDPVQGRTGRPVCSACPAARSALGLFGPRKCTKAPCMARWVLEMPFGPQNTPQGLFWNHVEAPDPAHCAYTDRPCVLLRRAHARLQPVF